MNSILKGLKEKQQSGIIFSIGDFLDLFNQFGLSKSNIHCLCLGEKIEFIPSLCYSSLDNQFIFYKKIRNIKDKLTDRNIILPKPGNSDYDYEVFEGNNFTIIVEDYDESDSGIYENYLRCCEILRDGSLNVRNHEIDNLNIVQNRIATSLATTQDLSGFSLSRIISETQAIKALHFCFLPNNQIKSHVKIDENNEFLLKLLDNEYKDYLLDCRKNGKPLSWKCNDLDKDYYYCLVPITTKYGETHFVTEFILLWSGHHFSINAVNKIIDIVDKYSSLGLLYRKINPLIKLQREAIENIHTSFFRSRKEFRTRFSAFVKKCLNQIINTTFAHSSTVRLYDPYYKSLYLFEEVSADWAKENHSVTDGDYSRIKIKQFKSSLNAFTFLKNSFRHSYCYIKNSRREIPAEYSTLGLQQILKRRDSLSEICFPLFCGKIPFGTMNIESMLKHAFEYDIEYLIGIKQTIESFYEISYKSNDSAWLSGRSPVYKNVHELSQLLRLDEKIFTEQQTDILQRLILIDDKIIPDHLVPIDKLQKDLLGWLAKNANELTLRNLVKNCIFDLKTKVLIRSDTYEKLLVICKNLYDNILDHGDSKRDKFFFIENDHLRMGVNANIKIFVKTFGCFDDDNFHNLLVSPILKDNEQHYGMFLIGVLARRLGGIALISQGHEEYSPYTILEISLPLKY